MTDLEKIKQIITDHEDTLDIRFSHLDKMIDQLREDQKAGQKAIIESVEKIVQLHVQNIETLVTHQDEKIDHVREDLTTYCKDSEDRFLGLDAKIKDLSVRVDVLEREPEKKAAGWWNKVKDKVLWGFVGLCLSGIAAVLIDLINKGVGKK